jgi:hypothetical protein
MKTLLIFLCMLFCSGRFDTEMNYTGSTPAGATVRTFLGINAADSIDFIRWKLNLTDFREFTLACSYGISKPNTNGFIDEKKVALKGSAKLNNGVLSLQVTDRQLSMQVLNANIMHLLHQDGTMIVGNGGWSYTLNSVRQLPTSEIHIKTQEADFTDSIVFEGRTPCRGIEELMIGKTRPECYKKKWLLYLYKSSPTASSGTYKISGSKTGNWKLKTKNKEKVIYSLDLNNGNTLDLLRVDDSIVYILNGNGQLMVGDHDFSYSLNRRTKN